MHRIRPIMSRIKTQNSLMAVGTDCTGRWKSNYHTIAATMAPEIEHELRILLLDNIACNHNSNMIIIVSTYLKTITNKKGKNKGKQILVETWQYICSVFISF